MKYILCFFLFGAWSSYGASYSQKYIANEKIYLPKIVGGEEAAKYEFPWLVALKRDGRVRCAGSLIDLDLVLTAAHCVVDRITKKTYSAKAITIIAGVHDQKDSSLTQQTLTAVKITRHSRYYNERLSSYKLISKNDIALVTLKTRFMRTRYVRTIGLPKSNKTDFECPGGIGIVAGWGLTSLDGNASQILQKVEVPEVADEHCEYRKSEFSGTQFCVGGKGKASCRGDSGGPFVCKHDLNTVRGIVSYGTCGYTPSVFTRVSHFVPWIYEHSNFSYPNSNFGADYILILIFLTTSSIIIIFIAITQYTR